MQLDERTFVCDEDITPYLEKYIQKKDIVNKLTIGQCSPENEQVKVYSEKISSPYPGEAALNVKKLDNCIVCNTKYVGKTIQVYAAANDLNLYHCNQGYVGCSSVLINFLRKYNVNYVELTDKPLTDIGGIVPIFEEI